MSKTPDPNTEAHALASERYISEHHDMVDGGPSDDGIFHDGRRWVYLTHYEAIQRADSVRATRGKIERLTSLSPHVALLAVASYPNDAASPDVAIAAVFVVHDDDAHLATVAQGLAAAWRSLNART